MFTRSFMKVFPIRKYANITAKSTITITKAAASPATSGSSTKQRSDLEGRSFTSWSLRSCSSLSTTSTPSMRSSATRKGQPPTR